MTGLAPDAAVDAAALAVPHVRDVDVIAILDAAWPAMVAAARDTPAGHRWVLLADDEAERLPWINVEHPGAS